MPSSFRRRAFLTILALVAPLAWWGGLQRPAPLFLNLGAGDRPFANGFRDGWERDGLTGGGETMFHWAGDGARLDFPVEVLSGAPTLRMRVARFSPGAAAAELLAADRIVDRWDQPSRGWAIRDVVLGDVRGPLSLRFQIDTPNDDPLGLALDWAEVRGVHGLSPTASLWPGLLSWALGVPLVLAFSIGFEGGVVAFAALTALSAAGIFIDRLGGLVATADAGLPAFLVMIGLTIAWRLIKRGDMPVEGSRPLLVPAAACAAGLIAICHPFFYYPDVDNHAQYLAAIRADPSMVIDSSEYQLRTGAFTQKIGGQRVAFPYSAAFHVTAWPLAPWLGEITAIKTVAVLAMGVSLLLVHSLATGIGLTGASGMISQAIVVLLPVTASGLTLARYPTFLGQALDLLLLVHLVRRYPQMNGRRAASIAVVYLTLAQATYTGSLLNVAWLVGFFVAWEFVDGDRARARRLLAAYTVALVLVLAALYGRFIPVVLRDIVPHLGESQDQTPVATSASMWSSIVGARLGVFYGYVYPALTAAGLFALRRCPPHARRLVIAALLAGLAQLALRPIIPTLFRHAKEVQLLAGPVAVLSAAALLALWRRGKPGQLTALAVGASVSWWGARAAVSYYVERFFSVGR